MSKQLAPVCRIIQRPNPSSFSGTVTYMQRPGTTYTDVMVGDRRECLRTAIQVAANRADYERKYPEEAAAMRAQEARFAAEAIADEQPDDEAGNDPDEYDPTRCPHCYGAGVSHDQPDGCSGCNGSGQRRKGYWNNYGRDWDDSED